ncbi:[protein-PII] uridylyltransferase [Opitutus terrae]|uniref:Bifunctional uridylyltransferase/uridylyl-removing enzyme n=1 Tax=Opitutus terrae (strain DSM 11246 / JCM 15787 / PB90-1) TaxID=452637 RepID=B1ZYQ2_OPITP|nr:[protein-PII] uridylyltransferase [Opitutus terrae]ACB75288.1 UTP-GlnB uridylyltransferase, GlnD [Opitutus terrae PB90-1]
MFVPTPVAPEDPLAFTGAATRAERLAACKTYLANERHLLHERHKAGASGLEIVHAWSATIDHMLLRLFDAAMLSHLQATGAAKPPVAVALIALGGYGRGELSPLSDIDVMFLLPAKTKPAAIKPFLEHLTNEILYPLWDCKLKVGHSIRNVDEVFTEARKDIQTLTSLLESRLAAGSTSLYETFEQAYRAFSTTEDPKGYIAARLDDQAQRRAKYGDTVFLQEPDLKNGVGGLRDYQNAVWMARVKLGITQIEELATQNYLRHDELAAFTRAYDFLLRVRNELHFINSRATDLLDLDHQPRVARQLGYTEANLLVRVEHFMQDYYRSAQTIFRISKLIESRLALTIGRDAKGGKISIRDSLLASRFRRTKKIDGFVLRGSDLAAESPAVFEQDPVRLIRVFRHRQQLDCELDFNLGTLIRQSLHLLTPDVRASQDANVSFRAILSEPGAVFPALNLMHELGVLNKFVPEFAGLTCLVQHEFYHRYTADVHTLEAVRQLDLIFTEAEPITLKYRQALHETSDPALLYLTLLLHDIGKSEGIKGHAEAGAALAAPILERLGVSPEGRELVTFVIKNHLVMARFWQKRDVDDPQTAAAFAEIVGDAERLRNLYVHTFCDARGTAASLWNSYKDTLHTRLFLATLEHLNLGEAVHANYEKKKHMTQQELIARTIPGVATEEIVAHFGLLPDRYFIQTEPDEISLHIRMVHRLLKSITTADSVGSLKPVIEWQDDLNRSLTVVNVVTWDRAGLFYKLAGAFSVAGLSILGAKIISRSDHIAIDTFYVVEPGRGVVQSAAAQEAFARTIEAALVSNKDLYPDIVAQAKKLAASRYTGVVNGEALHTAFPPTVEVYHELAMQRTIVEIQARDQIGLLYRLAKIISDQGFDITFARIGTERGVAIDTFYIESSEAGQPIDTPRLQVLRDALTEAIKPEAAAVATV